MKRLFIGLELPPDISEHIYSLRGGLIGATFTKKENLHLCLRFLGGIEEPDIRDIESALNFIRFPAFSLSFSQIGIFKSGLEPRDLWTGIASGAGELTQLYSKVSTAVGRCRGVCPEKHKFYPHIRIAELQGTSMDAVQNYIIHNNLFHTRPFEVEYFTLFSSYRNMNGEGSFFTTEAHYGLSLIKDKGA